MSDADNTRSAGRQLGFYFDQSRCTGCYACAIACRDWHDVQDTGVHWRTVVAHEWGTYPNVKLAYVSLSCLHCADPLCAAACPAGAVAKRPQDGIMTVDRGACLGGDACGRCREACPYDIPQFGTHGDDRMQMCTFCADRIDAGEQPICVEACPMRALDWGPLAELREKYGAVPEVRGFAADHDARPSILFRPRYCPADAGSR